MGKMTAGTQNLVLFIDHNLLVLVVFAIACEHVDLQLD